MKSQTRAAIVIAIRYLALLGLYGDFTAVMVFALDPTDLAFYKDIGRKLDATLMSKKKKVALDKLNESLGQIRDNLVVNLLKEGKHLDILKHFLQDSVPYTDVFNDAAPFKTKVGDHVMVPGIDATSDVTGVAGGRSGLAHWLHVVTPVTRKALRLAKRNFAKRREQGTNGPGCTIHTSIVMSSFHKCSY